MKKILKSIYYILFLIPLIWAVNVHAKEEFESWKNEFYQEAQNKGISVQLLDQVVPKMSLLERVIKLDTEKPFYVQSFYDYTKARLSDYRIENGKKMLSKYKTWLNRAEEKFGVPKSYLVAFWGMETNYGSYKGNVDMLNSLASLAYHPRRRRFFTNELIGYLKIMDKEPSVAPEFGSWDGGFGNFQFMPTTFLAYAIDADNNGRRDIVHNIPDSIFSAANYLSSMGWKRSEPWGREVQLPTNFDWSLIREKSQRSVLEWKKLGIKPKHVVAFPNTELNTIADWYAPMGNEGPVFLTYPNFKIIMRWNKLALYAISVGLLADIINGEYQPLTPPDDFKPLKTSEIICLQEKLKDRGYHVGEPDGKIGSKTGEAIRHFQHANGLTADAYPGYKTLLLLECKNDEN